MFIDQNAFCTRAKLKFSLLLPGTYSRLELCFVFKRNAGFYFVQLFIPATAIVITSWLSLWLERDTSFADMIEVCDSRIFF